MELTVGSISKLNYQMANFDSISFLTGFRYTTNGGAAWLTTNLTGNAWTIALDLSSIPDGELVFGVELSNYTGLTAAALLEGLSLLELAGHVERDHEGYVLARRTGLAG